ncbi:unnamed protein product [Diamesa tonsa]
MAELPSLPSELISNNQPLIGFAGLTLNNPTHNAIFESFSNRYERQPIQFKLIANNYEFPSAKPKRQSYEYYNPRNILKRNWMLKHLHVLPSCIVLFQDIEWHEPQWAEKQKNCATQIQQLKNSLQDRFTRIAIVLLQKSSQSLANDDLLASERAASLTNLCGINAKQLFLLPYNDPHLLGYTVRLESAFLEHAQSYYIQMLKQIRVHRDQLTGAHQTLKVRHQFKMGFLSEMRFDSSTALKHYSQAYSALDDIRIVDTNCLEIKTIAGFINYKICKLMFKLNVPRDSITQFKTHIEKFKMRFGFKELIFEHYAWLSLQFNYFAELFCEAIKNGLPALQTQHPGIYYHKAAEYLCKRRESFLHCCDLSPTEPSSSSPTQFSALYSDFFGVRNGVKNADSFSDQQIISLVQELERKFSYSTAIISLLGQAMAQFKIYRCGRFRKKLAIDMAEEYFKSGEYTKALTLYSLMLSDYRQDKWYTIFTEIILKTLQSAILAASVNDFISTSIESLSPNIHLTIVERQNILENLWKVFNNVPPLPLSQIAPELKISWDNALANYKSSVTVDLDQIVDLIDCKVTFQKHQIKFTEIVALNLYIRSNSEVPIKIKSISVVLTTNKKAKIYHLTASLCSEYVINRGTKMEQLIKTVPATDLMLEYGKCYKLEVIANQYEFMENVEIEIHRVEIQMGSDKNVALLSIQKSLNQTRKFQRYNTHKDYMENINIIPFCYVIPSFHLTTQTVQENQPMLVNQYYKVETNIFNNFDICLQNVGISINLPTNLKNMVFLTTDVTATPTQELNSFIKIDIGELQMHTTTTLSYYLISMKEGNIELKQNLWYQTVDMSNSVVAGEANLVSTKRSLLGSPSTPPDEIIASELMKDAELYENNHNITVEYLANNLVQKMREEIVIVPCVEEMKLTTKLYTLNRDPLLKCYQNEDFLMHVSFEIQSPFNLDIIDAYFVSDFNIVEKAFQDKRDILRKNLVKGSKIDVCLMLNAKNTTKHWLSKENYLQEPNYYKNIQAMFQPKQFHTKNYLAESVVESNNDTVFDDPFSLKIKDAKLSYNNSQNIKNSIYNNTINAVELEEMNGIGKGGFFNAKFNVVNKLKADSKVFGLYCIKWKETNSDVVSESKFVVTGLEIIEPPINIYCYIKQRLYVREVFTLKITLKNPTKNILHLIATLKSCEGFMFAGHRQLNITVFSYSKFDLCFNLYPLKSNFQPLPELQLEYNTAYETQSDENILANETRLGTDDSCKSVTNQKQLELNGLIQRWMPKILFVHPPIRKFN